MFKELGDRFLASLPVTTRNQLVGDEDGLYRRETDPDSETIAKARKKVSEYERLINENERKMTAIDQAVTQLKRLAAEQKQSGQAAALRQTQAQALGKMKQRQALASENESLRKRRDNIQYAAENLRKQKREEEDEDLLREMNVRLKVGQEKLDVTQRQTLVGEARNLNRNVERNSSLLDSPLQLNDSLQQDDLLLAEFDALELDDSALQADPVSYQQQQQRNVRTNSGVTLDSEYS